MSIICSMVVCGKVHVKCGSGVPSLTSLSKHHLKSFETFIASPQTIGTPHGESAKIKIKLDYPTSIDHGTVAFRCHSIHSYRTLRIKRVKLHPELINITRIANKFRQPSTAK